MTADKVSAWHRVRRKLHIRWPRKGGGPTESILGNLLLSPNQLIKYLRLKPPSFSIGPLGEESSANAVTNYTDREDEQDSDHGLESDQFGEALLMQRIS